MSLVLTALPLLAVVSAVLVITAGSPVISALFLISLFVNVATYLVSLGIGFIGLAYIVVYVGAVAVLFLFVIMMMNLQQDEISNKGPYYTQNVPLAVMLGTLFIAVQYTVAQEHSATDTLSRARLAIQADHYTTDATLLHATQQGVNVSMYLGELFTVDAPQLLVSTVNTLQVNSLASVLYTHGAVWIMLLACTLLLAIVSPIILTTTAFSSNTAKLPYLPFIYKRYTRIGTS